MSRIKLFSVVGGDFRLLEPFIRHYVNIGVDEIVFSIHLPEDTYFREVWLDYIRELVETHGAKIGSVWHNDGLDHGRRLEERRALVAQYCSPSDWIILPDLDEFQIHSEGLENSVDLCESRGYDYIPTRLIDRLAPHGILPELAPKHLWSQFPLEGCVTKGLLGGGDEKVGLARASLSISPGQHECLTRGALPCPEEQSPIQIHHFKWDASVVARLRQRITLMKNEGVSWWTESKIILDHIHANGGCIDISDPRFAVRPSALRFDSL